MAKNKKRKAGEHYLPRKHNPKCNQRKTDIVSETCKGDFKVIGTVYGAKIAVNLKIDKTRLAGYEPKRKFDCPHYNRCSDIIIALNEICFECHYCPRAKSTAASR